MKPLPLLLTLSLLAILSGFLLMQRSPSPTTASQTTRSSTLTPLPDAPLPIDFVEPEIPDIQPPLLEGDLVVDPELITFVEEALALQFSQQPTFTPVPSEELITTVEQALNHSLASPARKALNVTCERLGILPSFQPLNHTLTTILAGETRGLITPTRNLILHDFQPSSPPEQAALVNLLAQRLLSQQIPFPPQNVSVDQLLSRHLLVQTLALQVEREFRISLPPYPASLNENLRESILLGLPSFFHELSTFAEFHLLEKFSSSTDATTQQIIDAIALTEPSPSRQLLAYPFRLPASKLPSTLGALPLYLILLEATDPTTARTLATALLSDTTKLTDGTLIWTLTFARKQTPPRIAEFLRSYYSLRDSERKIRLEVSGSRLIITSRS